MGKTTHVAGNGVPVSKCPICWRWYTLEKGHYRVICRRCSRSLDRSRQSGDIYDQLVWAANRAWRERRKRREWR